MHSIKWLILCVVVLWSIAIKAQTEESWPDGVKRIKVAEAEFQVRALGQQHQGPAILLLSGPNEHWHSDTGWFALLQPILATKYRTYAIDRLGQGLSSDAEHISYRRFAADLIALCALLNETEVVLLSFASGSISSVVLTTQAEAPRIQGMLLIDPDIPRPASTALYKGYPTDWYKANLAELLPALKTGVWTERTATKLLQEREHVEKLLPADYARLMDWRYFDFMAQQRLRVERQQSRAKEIAMYDADLDLYQALPLYTKRPVSVINSDFEQQQIKQNSEQKQQLIEWQQEGDDWSKAQAAVSGGQYIELQDADHLVMFQHPQALLKAVDWLMAQPVK